MYEKKYGKKSMGGKQYGEKIRKKITGKKVRWKNLREEIREEKVRGECTGSKKYGRGGRKVREKSTGNKKYGGKRYVFVTSGEKGPTRVDIAPLSVCACAEHTSEQGHFWSCMRNGPIPLDPPQMLLENLLYTTSIYV